MRGKILIILYLCVKYYRKTKDTTNAADL